MAEEVKNSGDEVKAEKSAEEKPASKPAAAVKTAAAAPSVDEHYEVVSEYRIGEGPPPLFLIVCFFFIVLWAMFSWIPFFGY
ncbi:MAG: hypothetical protein DKT66_17195 [Candidatus Melainabacteria bacterium]|nr:MAG: hypothetical protein DKT66_17195 [Candidatus Melainabacteria bacterium]